MPNTENYSCNLREDFIYYLSAVSHTQPLNTIEQKLIQRHRFLSQILVTVCIAVPAQKILGGNEVLPKFCDICPNHDFIVHFGYDKKIV